MGREAWPEEAGESRARFLLRGSLAAFSRRGAELELAFRADQSLRHVAEVLGVPACEIGAAEADGEAWPLELPPPDGAAVALFPVPEPRSLGERPRFLSDTHLGRLSRELRLLGFDSAWRAGMSRDETIELALGEGRILLSADRALLFRRELARGRRGEGGARAMLLVSKDPVEQLVGVCARWGLAELWRPLSLCSACGRELEPIALSMARPRVPPVVAAKYCSFQACPACMKVFWKGDHARSIEPLLERLRRGLAARESLPGDGPSPIVG